jgi:hypothetical protein
VLPVALRVADFAGQLDVAEDVVAGEARGVRQGSDDRHGQVVVGEVGDVVADDGTGNSRCGGVARYERREGLHSDVQGDARLGELDINERVGAAHAGRGEPGQAREVAVEVAVGQCVRAVEPGLEHADEAGAIAGLGPQREERER